jgi:hypothetical protein
VAKALNRFETYTKFRDFKAFHIEQAKGFMAILAGQASIRTKDRRSTPRPKAVLHLAGRTTRVQVPDLVLRRRIVYPVGQEDEDRQAPSRRARADA